MKRPGGSPCPGMIAVLPAGRHDLLSFQIQIHDLASDTLLIFLSRCLPPLAIIAALTSIPPHHAFWPVSRLRPTIRLSPVNPLLSLPLPPAAATPLPARNEPPPDARLSALRRLVPDPFVPLLPLFSLVPLELVSRSRPRPPLPRLLALAAPRTPAGLTRIQQQQHHQQPRCLGRPFRRAPWSSVAGRSWNRGGAVVGTWRRPREGAGTGGEGPPDLYSRAPPYRQVRISLAVRLIV